ncbi:LysR family transcriptional regulator [Lacrimispora amygdalina]|uniref:LysR family transcriptional regulator n=1 Tax=Lacrimispora amygdalina TaxID=253257 RepID=A0ABQ5M9N5_9FIRM|nr:LysR family transcriptional regulator [Petroclostridium sp. X23]WHH60772.1 LysR family transcriptional regulator [Petroclostridium sp. X23]
MKIEHIKYFLEICNCKSISKASKNLYLSQQALSSAVKRIETDLGVELFIRNQSGMILTPYGESFKERAIKIIQHMESISSDFEQIRKKEQQILNIAMSFGVISALPEGYINNFKLLHPDIILNITEYQDLPCEEAILNEHEDIGFNIAPIDETSFDCQTILKNRMCILVSKDNPLSQNVEIDFHQLKNEEFLLLNNNFKLRHNFVKKCKEAGFNPKISLETMELILIHNFSRLNKGIGVGVHFIGMDIADVKAIPFKNPDCTWEVCVIIKKNRPLTPAMKCFLDYINNQKYYII